MIAIIFEHLPKISLNEFYTMHWGKKKKILQKYDMLVTHIVYKTFGGRVRVKEAKVKYDFTFAANALDCLNCSGMIKILEDIIFTNDSPKEVRQLTIKSSEDCTLTTPMKVVITIESEQI